MAHMLDRLEQEARNQTVFREMNEWTREDNNSRGGAERPMDSYLCECSDRLCTEPINMTRPEYEAVRALAIRFAIALNHENPEIDVVVYENERFAAVEKSFGAGARIARETDPRH
jgi:hypothetical protein